MGLIDALFKVTDERLLALYNRAWLEDMRETLDTRKYPELDKAISTYARERNCGYNDALVFAKTGKKTGRLAEQKDACVC